MPNEITIADAIISLKPKAQFSLRGYVLEWLDAVQTEPTQSEIQAEVTRLQTEYDSLAYARSRKQEYDKLNQWELVSDDSINGTTTHKDAILAIKAKYPKPI